MHSYEANRKIAAEMFGQAGIDDIRSLVPEFFIRLASDYSDVENYASPTMCAIDGIMDISDNPTERARAIVQMIYGIADARKDTRLADKIKDNICMTIAYKVTEYRGGKPNIVGDIISSSMSGELFEAVEKIAPGGVGLQRFIARCSVDALTVYDPTGERKAEEDRRPAHLLVDKAIKSYPDLALSVDVASMLGKLAMKNSAYHFHGEEEEQAAVRVIVASLGAWLDNTKEKPYRLHLMSGPKEATSVLIGGMAVMKIEGLLNDEDILELTKGKRGARLDKTLARATSLIGAGTYENRVYKQEDVLELRAMIRRASFTKRTDIASRSTSERPPI